MWRGAAGVRARHPVRARSTFSKPIAQHQAIAFQLAEMATKVRWHLMMVNAARLGDSGERQRCDARNVQYMASELCAGSPSRVSRIHGGYGYSRYEIERLMRDAPFLLIGEGTSEIRSRSSQAAAAEYRI